MLAMEAIVIVIYIAIYIAISALILVMIWRLVRAVEIIVNKLDQE